MGVEEWVGREVCGEEVRAEVLGRDQMGDGVEREVLGLTRWRGRQVPPGRGAL